MQKMKAEDEDYDPWKTKKEEALALRHCGGRVPVAVFGK